MGILISFQHKSYFGNLDCIQVSMVNLSQNYIEIALLASYMKSSKNMSYNFNFGSLILSLASHDVSL